MAWRLFLRHLRLLLAIACLTTLGLLWKVFINSNELSTALQVVKKPVESMDSKHLSAGIEMDRRRKLVHRACSEANATFSDMNDSKDRFLVDRARKLAMCYVPKAGCTFWKRVFLALQHSENQTKLKRHFFDMYKEVVHGIYIENLSEIPHNETNTYLKAARKILFVRDPYSRLYSAYIDKFVLSDYWTGFGRMIVGRYRKSQSERCGYDVTFVEFLQYVLFTTKWQVPRGGLEHWFPISKLCNPCRYGFDFIGKQESFSLDVGFISQMVGINIPPSIHAKPLEEKVVYESMRESAVVMWDKMKRLPVPCQNSTLKFERLLTAFAAQGFFPPGVTLPWSNTENVTLDEYLNFAISIYKQQNLTKELFSKRRRQQMVSAFRSVPEAILRKIKEIYDMDFLLFGYESSPTDIFPNIKNIKNLPP